MFESTGEDSPRPLVGEPARSDPTLPDPAEVPVSETQGLPSAIEATQSPPAVPASKRRRAVLPTTLRVVQVVLTLLLGIGTLATVYGVRQYNALDAAIYRFCGDLEHHQYAQTYQDLSARLRVKYSLEDFTAIAQTLDHVEGNVLSCGQSGSNAVSVNVLDRSITAEANVNRDISGAYRGQVTFRLEGSGWQVDQLSTPLLGVNPDSLLSALTFCANLEAQNYAAVYSSLGHQLRAATSQADFAQVEQLHDLADGNVLDCSVVGIAKGNTDSQSNMTMSITRSALAEVQGPVRLVQERNSWTLASIDAALQGRDVTPIIAMDSWCSDIASANYAAAYAISSPQWQGTLGEGHFAATFSGQSGGVKWTGCAPDPTTYYFAPPTATLTGSLSQVDLATHQNISQQAEFVVLLQGSDWKIHLIIQCGGTCIDLFA